MEIVKASGNDCEEILKLQKLAYEQEAVIYNDYSIAPLTQTIDELYEEIQKSTVFKISVENKIVGSIRGFAENGICQVGRLIVHPDYQNNGLGTLLLNTLETYFRIQGTRQFELFTGEKSKKNLYLYQKLGYQIFKTEALNDKVNLVYLHK